MRSVGCVAGGPEGPAGEYGPDDAGAVPWRPVTPSGGPMSTIEERVQELADKDEIRELTARYCLAVAEGDADTLVALFCPDGTFTAGDRQYSGLEGLRELYGGLAAGVPPKPFIQNHVIEVDGDTATGRCGAEIRMVRKGEAYTTAGHYADVYRRVDGRWRFASRNFMTYHSVPLSRGWA